MKNTPDLGQDLSHLQGKLEEVKAQEKKRANFCTRS